MVCNQRVPAPAPIVSTSERYQHALGEEVAVSPHRIAPVLLAVLAAVLWLPGDAWRWWP